MNQTNRRQALGSLLKLAGAVPLLGLTQARAAEFTIKCGTTLSTDHPLTKGVMRAAEQVRKTTAGRVDIQVFPNSQLGSQTDMMSQLRSGALEMTAVSSVVLSTLTPLTAISGVAYAFADYPDVWRVMDGELGAYMRRSIEKSGIVVFDRVYNGGFYQMMSAPKPILTAADLSGFKIRVPPAPIWVSLYKALGASPAAINWGEVYTALQTKIVDGVDSSVSNFSDSKLYEVQKYVSLTNHLWDGYWILSNRAAFERLSADLREVVRTAFNNEALTQRTEVEKVDAATVTKLEARGLKIARPDPASFQEMLRRNHYYADWKAKFGDEAWNLLQRSTAKTLA